MALRTLWGYCSKEALSAHRQSLTSVIHFCANADLAAKSYNGIVGVFEDLGAGIGQIQFVIVG